MKKSNLLIGLASGLATLMLVGCGTSGTMVVDAPADRDVVSPVVKALEEYDSIISGLNENQYYGFAAGEEYDLLLVTDGVFDNGDGNMAAIDATIYGHDADGNVIEMGIVMSEGTAYPIACYDSKYIMFGGNHHVGMEFVQNGNVITYKDATEVFDENGNATYFLFDYEKQFEGEVEDDSALTELYDLYSKAIVINFNKAK